MDACALGCRGLRQRPTTRWGLGLRQALAAGAGPLLCGRLGPLFSWGFRSGFRRRVYQRENRGLHYVHDSSVPTVREGLGVALSQNPPGSYV